MHKHDSSEVIRYSPQNPYAFLDRWPRSIQEDRPEHCSFRQQEKMRKKLNHLSVRLGLGLPDSKRFVPPKSIDSFVMLLRRRLRRRGYRAAQRPHRPLSLGYAAGARTRQADWESK